MTVKAREVLQDCRFALSLLEDDEGPQKWRIHWMAAVALIRAVGHVLYKVDGTDLAIEEAARASFQAWKRSDDPQHEIFREFIERERNNLLKEYSSDVHPNESVAIMVETSTQQIDEGVPQKEGHVYEIGENIYRPLLDGPWTGEDARDVLTEAINWWELQLDAIDQKAAMIRSVQSKA